MTIINILTDYWTWEITDISLYKTSERAFLKTDSDPLATETRFLGKQTSFQNKESKLSHWGEC